MFTSTCDLTLSTGSVTKFLLTIYDIMLQWILIGIDNPLKVITLTPWQGTDIPKFMPMKGEDN